MTHQQSWPQLSGICDPEILRASFQHIADRTREDGLPSLPVDRFRKNLSARLETLAAELRCGVFRPDRYSTVVIEDSHAKVRHLHIPSVRDRVVERSIVQLLTPWVDPRISSAAHGYRPGLGVATASNELARLRDQGFRWVVRSDFLDCFAAIDRAAAQLNLADVVNDPGLAHLLDMLFARRDQAGLLPMGLPQGSPLSPLLANLFLTRFDDALLEQGTPLVRYADDFVLTSRTHSEATTALRSARAAAAELGMSLNEDKTEVTTFDEGFCFLGEDFGPRLPTVSESTRATKTSSLYVTRQGGRVRIHAGRLIVESPTGEQLASLPSSHISRIITVGAVSISAGARSWGLYRGVEQVHLSRRGAYLGRTVPATATRADRVRAQVYLGDDPDRSLDLGRALLEGKLRKQRIGLLRVNRRTSAAAIKDSMNTINGCIANLAQCRTGAELMGQEGASAGAYFRALQEALPRDLGYAGRRTRRPPQDLINAALSFGYALLSAEATGAIATVGLEPSLGVLHRDHRQRPSLALDLMEEFRPWVVDQAVIALARQHRLRSEHAADGDPQEGVRLTDTGRQILIDAYEVRMNTTVKGSLPNFSGTIRRHLQRQAERLANAILDPTNEFSGVTWR